MRNRSGAVVLTLGLVGISGLTACEGYACPAIAYPPFIEANVYGDASSLYRLTACPASGPDCVATGSDDPVERNAAGRYRVELGEGVGPDMGADARVVLRAENRDGKVLASTLMAPSWRQERPNDRCGGSKYAIVSITLPG